MFNILFSETNYDLIGFIKTNERLDVVLKQPRVHGNTLANLPNFEKEYKMFLKHFIKLGYKVNIGDVLENSTISKNGFEAADLNRRNIMKTPGGAYYVIDAFVRKI